MENTAPAQHYANNAAAVLAPAKLLNNVIVQARELWLREGLAESFLEINAALSTVGSKKNAPNSHPPPIHPHVPVDA